MINIKRINACTMIIIALSSSNLSWAMSPGMIILHTASLLSALYIADKMDFHPAQKHRAQNAVFKEQEARANALAAQYQAEQESHKLNAAQSTAQAAEYSRKLEIFRSSEEFKKCMTSHYNPKNAMQIPSACNDFARAFAEAAGQKEVDEVVEIFNKYPVS